MASFKVTYTHPGTQPPVYVAGSFSEPPWSPQEMEFNTLENHENEFYKVVTVQPGEEHQYKFRLGPGDWWVIDETAPTVTDSAGNRNNLLTVSSSYHSDSQSAFAPTTNGTRKTEVLPGHAAVDKLKPNGVNHLTNGETISRHGSSTPDIASVASEVADSATELDRDQPTPPISDEEAGRIGFRRMSNTPIPEVADTAAEVADSAAMLDKENMKIEMPANNGVPDIFDFQADSGVVTPWEDRVPLFEHECGGSFGHHLHPKVKFESLEPELPIDEEVLTDEDIDINDPTLERFPSERSAILERVRTVETSLDADQTKVDGVPPSPVVGANKSPDRAYPPSPNMDQTTPLSLDSKSEDTESREERLTRLPSAISLRSNRLSELNRITEEDDNVENGGVDSKAASKEIPDAETGTSEPTTDPNILSNQSEGSAQQDSQKFSTEPGSGKDEKFKQANTEDAGPQIHVQPATPGSSTANLNPSTTGNDEAKSTGVEAENGSSSILTSRRPAAPPLKRSNTPNSIGSEHAKKSQNVLQAFWRVVFVDWLGGLITRLCGSRRHTLLAISALLLLTVAPALYLRA